MREHLTHTHTHTLTYTLTHNAHTHARIRGRYHSHIRDFCKYVHAHIQWMRAGRSSRYLVASLHYRTRERKRELSNRASEREKVTAEAENHFLYRAPHRPFGEESMRPPLAILQKFSFCAAELSFFYPLLLEEHTPSHVNKWSLWKRARRTSVYIPTNFYSDSVNLIYIADRSSRNNRRDNREPSQISTLLTSRSIVVYRKKRRKKDRELRDTS